ncbi:MAG: T9SS type A sorting domain-containing protein, partial [candidate division WOR-3 bacterium]
KAPRPHNAACEMDAVWRDSLIYCCGGTDLSIGYALVDIYSPFTNTWSSGTAMPYALDMGNAVIIGDTIYIPGAVINRTNYLTYLVKGAINPANPNQITWIIGPALPPYSPPVTATVIGNTIYWLSGNMGGGASTIWYYTVGSDTVLPFIPYPIAVTRTQMVARTDGSIQELYVLAGDSGGNWNPPNRTYMKYTFGVGVNEPQTNQTATFLELKPNPSSKEVKITYSIPARHKIELIICDASGRIITRRTEEKDAGQYEYIWYGKDQKGKIVPNGIYFVRLKAGNNLQTQKLTLVQ